MNFAFSYNKPNKFSVLKSAIVQSVGLCFKLDGLVTLV